MSHKLARNFESLKEDIIEHQKQTGTKKNLNLFHGFAYNIISTIFEHQCSSCYLSLDKDFYLFIELLFRIIQTKNITFYNSKLSCNIKKTFTPLKHT